MMSLLFSFYSVWSTLPSAARWGRGGGNLAVQLLLGQEDTLHNMLQTYLSGSSTGRGTTGTLPFEGRGIPQNNEMGDSDT